MNLPLKYLDLEKMEMCGSWRTPLRIGCLLEGCLGLGTWCSRAGIQAQGGKLNYRPNKSH